MNVFSLGVVPRPPGLGCAPPYCLARHSGVGSATTRNLCRGEKSDWQISPMSYTGDRQYLAVGTIPTY